MTSDRVLNRDLSWLAFTTFSAVSQLYSSLDLPRLKDRPQSLLPVRAFEFGAASRIVSPVPLGKRMQHSRCTCERGPMGLGERAWAKGSAGEGIRALVPGYQRRVPS